MTEYKRIIITKWRLSSHRLRIETGRFDSPKTPRDKRVCSVCANKVEDEHHVLFECLLYNEIGLKFKSLFEKYTTVKDILSPLSIGDAEVLGSVLIMIENTRGSYGLEFIAT